MHAQCFIVALCCLRSMNAVCLWSNAPHSTCMVYGTFVLHILHSFHVQPLKKYFCCYFYFQFSLGGPVIEWISFEASLNGK